MENYFEILKKCRMFTGLDIDDIKCLTEILNSKVVKYSKGDVIFSEGEKPEEHIGVVLHGNAQIERTDYYGNRSIVAVLEPSEVFGEAFVCAGIKSIPVDVVALDETVVMLLSLPDIPPQNTDIYNCFILNLLRTSSVKNLVLMKRLEVTSKRSTEEKLMTYLMQTAKEQGKSSFHITYDRQQLADYLEVDRSGLSAVIGKAKKAEKSNAAKICLNFCEDMRNKGFPVKSQHKPR